MVNATVDINLSNLNNLLLKELRLIIQSKLHSVLFDIKKDIVEIIKLNFYNSEHYISLLAGELRVEFGLENPDPMLKTIIESILASMQINLITKSDRTYLGGIEVKAFKSDFTDALSASGASYTSNSSRGTTLIQWLDWLLFAGDTVVLDNFAIYTGSNISNWSRTGEAIMIQRSKSSKTKAWRVPPKYSGVVGKNWLTYVADKSADPIINLMTKRVREALNV